jgi:SpoVK/Ycf46/Vps4 family AAA+-type ATPase
VAIGGLVDSYLGGTNANLIAAFRYAAAHPGLLFFDEFDALCGGRGGGDDLREMHRVVNGFLQSFDRDCQDTIVVAATNVPGAIDGAVWRRFDLAIEFPVPDRAMVHEYVQRRAATFPVDPPSGGDADYVSAAVAQVSMAGLERAVTRAMRGAVLGGVRLVTADALRAAVALCADRRIGREQVPVTPPRDT